MTASRKTLGLGRGIALMGLRQLSFNISSHHGRVFQRAIFPVLQSDSHFPVQYSVTRTKATIRADSNDYVQTVCARKSPAASTRQPFLFPFPRPRTFSSSTNESAIESEADNSTFVDSESKSSSFDAESVVYPSWDKHADAEIGSVESPSPAAARVDVRWRGGGPVAPFPLVWLRDNCRCPSCFNPEAKSRMVAMKDLDLDCMVETVSASEDNKSMIIHWTDGHVSQYPARWLRCNAFRDSDPDPVSDLQPRLWDASACRQRMRFFDFGDLLRDDRALFEMLREIKVFGITVVENAPRKLGQLHRLAERVGYLLPSNYGETFQVQSKVNPSNAAYTSGDLSIHTDLSYYNHPPGIQMLHCIQQAESEGGDNTLVDGFKIAADIRRDAPDLYDVLTRDMVEFYDTGFDAVGEYYQHSRHKIIRLDSRSRVDRIVFSDHGRSALTRVAAENVVTMYKALLSFASLLYSPVNVFEYKMKDGDILIMDNYRVLHGRKMFTMLPGTSRHLEGGYFQWDTVLSKLRVLKKALDAK